MSIGPPISGAAARSSGATAVFPFGDAAVLAEVGDLVTVHRLRRLLEAATDERLDAVEDVVVGFGTLTALFDPRRAGLETVTEAVAELAAAASHGVHEADGADGAAASPADIAVCFDGPDLDELAAGLAVDAADVVAMLTGAELQVAFVGFAPGFAYLVGLPPVLADVPRRPRPRPMVPAGSLAVGAGFAGIYPRAVPGGWHLVGRTGAVLFDPARPPYAALGPGRRVRLRPVGHVSPPSEPARSVLGATDDGPALVVEDEGACTLVEDRGRRGVAGLGVPRAGAADQVALRLANRLVGNPEHDAALEVTVRGPRLRARGELLVTVVGDPARPGMTTVLLDGRPVPEGQVVPVAGGQVLEVGDTGSALRAVVAVAGGLALEPLFGSCSSDLLSGLGVGPLREGDEIAVGHPGRPRGHLTLPVSLAAPSVLRVMAGPDGTDGRQGAQALEWIVGRSWRTAPDSNRIGTRLVADDGDPTEDVPTLSEMPSRGMVAGAVQLPPGGELVVLGPDHATVGGYPVPALVVSADLHRLAHLSPGQSVRFEAVDASEAAAALARVETAVDDAVDGWFPTRAG